MLTSRGEVGEYGNGSIFVSGENCVKFLPDEPLSEQIEKMKHRIGFV